jgi:CHAD domain-containing protein
MEKMPAIEDLRSQLERQLGAIEANEAGMREGTDPEPLHRFRVAIRRSRALIRASRPLIRDQLAVLDRELRWLGRASGPVRDLDVLIDHLSDVVEDLDPDQAGGWTIVAALERERLQQRDVLLKAIDSERYRELLARFQEMLPELRAADGDVRLARLARKELDRLRRAYEALGADPADDELHAVRIRAKHARYAAELAARSEGRPLAALADAIRDLQDLIGAHQDAVVAEARVRALATGDARVAAGRIVELERLRRAEARGELRTVWKRIERCADRVF